MSTDPTNGPECAGCDELPAAICTECLRAAALRDWGGVSRHPELLEPGAVAPCRLCGAGAPAWCPICWPGEVVAYRRRLVESSPSTYGHLAE